MSVSTKLLSPVSETRRILGPAGNRVKVPDEQQKRKKDVSDLKKPKSLAAQTEPRTDVQRDASVDSCCSLDSGSSNVKISGCKMRERCGNRLKSPSLSANGAEAETVKPVVLPPINRCDWITRFSDPLHTRFHDQEWGVPVHHDRKLFELLVLSQASSELTWPVILANRDIFRKLLDNFDPSSVAKLDENKLLSLRQNGNMLLSEQKFRAVVENANQVLKIQQEFGSFSAYCWRFVNHKPIQNGFRHARRVPAKTAKSEAISKDLMRRGFRCVGPIVVYSFMQVSGMVNDHLLTCFRYAECNNVIRIDPGLGVGTTATQDAATKAPEPNKHLS